MLYLGIDQHARQLTISLRDESGDVLQARQPRVRRECRSGWSVLSGRFGRRTSGEPTNNGAERVLRHAVLWRKSSGGTDSEAGSRFVERMLSVVATARQQNLGVLELLTACCQARLDGSAAPSLLPAQAELAAA